MNETIDLMDGALHVYRPPRIASRNFVTGCLTSNVAGGARFLGF